MKLGITYGHILPERPELSSIYRSGKVDIRIMY